MVQLNILSGRQAGGQRAVRRFPFRVGRAPENDLRLDDDGVWDKHLVLEFQKKEGFRLVTVAGALAAVNGRPVQDQILRNGDTLTLGSAKLQFWLAAPVQRGLHTRENFVWALVAIVAVAQVSLVYWLLP
ncbi:MAG: FHA domain-containing protein [Verrucomicrobiota bacterium]|nr:FHA domain-containing protein [Verrucomicrobiota bacterium]